MSPTPEFPESLLREDEAGLKREFTRHQYEAKLEQEFTQYSESLDVSEKALRAILAYMMWQDSAEWPFVEEIWFSDPYWTRENCIKGLREKFNYGDKIL